MSDDEDRSRERMLAMSVEELYALGAASRAQRERDEEAAKHLPPLKLSRFSKFADPIGMTRDGTPQAPLTAEERAHNEEVRRQAREKRDAALRRQEEAGQPDDRPDGTPPTPA